MNKMLADLQEFVFEINKNYRDKTAYRYIENDRIVDKSFADLTRDCFAVATWLKNYGLKGDKVAIIGGTSYPWIVTFLASAIGGNVVIGRGREVGAMPQRLRERYAVPERWFAAVPCHAPAACWIVDRAVDQELAAERERAASGGERRLSGGEHVHVVLRDGEVVRA